MKVLNVYQLVHVQGGEVGATKQGDDLHYAGEAKASNGPSPQQVGNAATVGGAAAGVAAALVVQGVCTVVTGGIGAGVCAVGAAAIGTVVGAAVTNYTNDKLTQQLLVEIPR